VAEPQPHPARTIHAEPEPEAEPDSESQPESEPESELESEPEPKLESEPESDLDLPSSAPSPTTIACSTMWQQCGGQTWHGASCCEAGSTCVLTNAFYSQCKPPAESQVDPTTHTEPELEAEAEPESTPGPKPQSDAEVLSPSLAPTLTTVACAAKWEQCGGKKWHGARCCEADSTCVFKGAYYSQCKPQSILLTQKAQAAVITKHEKPSSFLAPIRALVQLGQTVGKVPDRSSKGIKEL